MHSIEPKIIARKTNAGKVAEALLGGAQPAESFAWPDATGAHRERLGILRRMELIEGTPAQSEKYRTLWKVLGCLRFVSH